MTVKSRVLHPEFRGRMVCSGIPSGFMDIREIEKTFTCSLVATCKSIVMWNFLFLTLVMSDWCLFIYLFPGLLVYFSS